MFTKLKLNKKNLKFSIIYLFLSLFLLTGMSFIFNIEQVNAGGTTIAPLHTAEINVHGQCRLVTNNHASLSVWIPHLTAAEWDSFIFHHPGHVTLASCDPCLNVTCPTPGAWGACGGFTDACDTTGTQSRTVWTCSAGACVSSTETQACTRVTDGVTCAAAGAWGACGGFTDACDTTGTQSRTVWTCSAGACVSSTETQACTRVTDGVTCAAAGAWGACEYSATNVCDNTAERSRTVWTCSAGACVSSIETEVCATRNTDGTSCGSFVCKSTNSFDCNNIWPTCSGGICMHNVVGEWCASPGSCPRL